MGRLEGGEAESLPVKAEAALSRIDSRTSILPVTAAVIRAVRYSSSRSMAVLTILARRCTPSSDSFKCSTMTRCSRSGGMVTGTLPTICSFRFASVDPTATSSSQLRSSLRPSEKSRNDGSTRWRSGLIRRHPVPQSAGRSFPKIIAARAISPRRPNARSPAAKAWRRSSLALLRGMVSSSLGKSRPPTRFDGFMTGTPPTTYSSA